MAGRITPPEAALDASANRFAIVAARFHEHITSRLVEGALECFAKYGAEDVPVHWVPGSFELPLAAQSIIMDGEVDAVVALGCVIKGDTYHDQIVSEVAAKGLMDVMLDTGVPVALGVITAYTREQAEARAGGSVGNTGYDAAISAIEMAALIGSKAKVDPD